MKHLCLSALLGLSLLVGCSKQNEGATCQLSNGDQDCDSGLVCRGADELAGYDPADLYAASRCCPEDGNSSNSHCKLRDSSDTSTGGGGETSSGGTTGTEGGTTGTATTSTEGGTTSTETTGTLGGSTSGGATSTSTATS